VLIGATPEGKKELVGFQTGVRESAQSWRELLIDIKQRGLARVRSWRPEGDSERLIEVIRENPAGAIRGTKHPNPARIAFGDE
jgi:transposase-like protein